MAGRSRFWHTILRRQPPLSAPAGRAMVTPSTQPASSLIDSSALPVETEGFHIVRLCAQSPHSELYQARVAGTEEPVALKVVRFGAQADAPERFLREATAAGRLQHPAIVRTLGAGIVTQDGHPCGWLAMEWVPGSDLSRYAQPGRLLPEELVLRMAAVTAEALAHAHAQGVVHRDLKPGNLLFNPAAGGVLKVGDFGSARLLDQVNSRSGLMVGTPCYMAPEQLSGVPLDGRCDLYALGVVLFELLTGQRPFDRSSMGETLAAIAGEAPPPLLARRPELPAVLGDVLARMLAKSPADRHADGHALARELRLIARLCEVNRAAGGGHNGPVHKNNSRIEPRATAP